jgi:branched-chain amino acid transport system ATP-binding protein
MADDPILSINDLEVYYDKLLAVNDLSLTIERGNIVGLIGPNGAGKTTTLDAIAGLKSYDGTVTYKDRNLSRMDIKDIVADGIVYCTERRDLFPFLSVEANLLMGAHSRTDDDGIQSDLKMVYELFPRLYERRGQNAVTMSGGEQQMLAIGRSLMGDPDLLLLDEPTLGLAPVIIEEIRDVLSTLQEYGVTILLAEQNSIFSIDQCDQLFLLENGQIKLTGTAAEFKENDYVQEAYIGVV